MTERKSIKGRKKKEKKKEKKKYLPVWRQRAWEGT
jgi:hypothetical protein